MERGAVSTWPPPHTPQIKDPTTKYVSLSYTSRDQKNNHWVGLQMKWISFTRSSYAPILKGGPRWCFRSLDNKVNLDPMSNINQNVWVFLFPQCAVTPVSGCRSIWRKTRRIVTIYICHSVAGSFLETWYILQSVNSKSKNWLISRNKARNQYFFNWSLPSSFFWSSIYDFFWW